jgi:carbonyl reductase 1
LVFDSCAVAKERRDAPRVALVTGANRGIGLEVCRQVAQRGYVVVLGSRDEAKGREAAQPLIDERLTIHP